MGKPAAPTRVATTTVIIAVAIIVIVIVIVCGGVTAYVGWSFFGRHSPGVSNFLAEADASIGMLELGEADTNNDVWQAHLGGLKMAYCRIPTDDPERIPCNTLLTQIETVGKYEQNLKYCYYSNGEHEKQLNSISEQIRLLRVKLKERF